jgi:phosphatidylethanolamine-binding protein (PEBP) family uncharacterized protein
VALADVTIAFRFAEGGASSAAEPFTLTSSAFKASTPLAVKNSGDFKANPNCIGQNVSPPLAWANPPAATKSFALVIFDPEGRNGLTFVHLVAYGIPASVTSFAEGEVSKPSSKYVAAKAARNSRITSGRARRPTPTGTTISFS